jgi:hypothetical protein
VVVLELLPSRPFPWAENTTFDAWDRKNNRVVCQVDLEDEEDHEAYKELTAWLMLHMNTGKATELLDSGGTEILEKLVA